MSDTSANSALESGTWTSDPTATSIGFVSKLFLGLKVNGRFSRYEGTITVGDSAADSSAAVTIYTDSVDTGIKMRDGHLRADNVFDTASFPTLEFHSTAVTETPTGLDITGNRAGARAFRPPIVAFRPIKGKFSFFSLRSRPESRILLPHPVCTA